MSSALRRVVVALAGALLASATLGALSVVPAGSRSAAAGACTDASGVTVVVDFGAAGGGVQTRCAAAPVSSGFDALSKAGFDITNVRSQPGFLCQIDGIPTSDCSRIPSASRYWSYWHAARGEDWIYSTSGASRRPPAGSVEGWAFGASDPPGVSPPAPIAPPTTRPTAVTTSRPSATSSTSVTPGASTPPDPSGSTTTTATDAAPPVPDGTTTSRQSSSGDGGSTTTEDGDTQPELRPASTGTEDDPGSAAGLIAAGALVAGVGVVGVRTARRRARDAEGAE